MEFSIVMPTVTGNWGHSGSSRAQELSSRMVSWRQTPSRKVYCDGDLSHFSAGLKLFESLRAVPHPAWHSTLFGLELDQSSWMAGGFWTFGKLPLSAFCYVLYCLICSSYALQLKTTKYKIGTSVFLTKIWRWAYMHLFKIRFYSTYVKLFKIQTFRYCLHFLNSFI